MTLETREERQIYLYRDCPRVRTHPVHEVNEEIIKEVGNNYRVSPSFEKTLYEQVHIRHYSLKRNEYLGCRWKQFKENLDKHVTEPFQFPSSRDEHFYIHCVRFIPAESIFRKKHYVYQLKPGPGVDEMGQIPIPHERFMKRLKGEEKKAKKTTKTVAQNLHKKQITNKVKTLKKEGGIVQATNAKSKPG